MFSRFISYLRSGLNINVCPIPVKTNVGQIDLVLRLSDGTNEKIRDSQACRYDRQIYFHWYKILGLLYKIKLKWNARSKLFYCIIYRSSIWSSRTLTKLNHNLRNALMNGHINIWNIRTRITPERTLKNYRISIWGQM